MTRKKISKKEYHHLENLLALSKFYAKKQDDIYAEFKSILEEGEHGWCVDCVYNELSLDECLKALKIKVKKE